MLAMRAAARACLLWSLLAAPAACQAAVRAAAQAPAGLATFPPIVSRAGAAPPPVTFTQADAAALSDALSVLEAAAPAVAGKEPGAMLYTSYAAVPGAGAEDLSLMTPGERLRCAPLVRVRPFPSGRVRVRRQCGFINDVLCRGSGASAHCPRAG